MNVNKTAIQNSHGPAACPACGSGSVGRLGTLQYGALVSFAGTPVAPTQAPQLEECLSCGTWFTTNAVTPSDAMHLYASGRGDVHWKADAFEFGKTPEVVQAIEALLFPGIDVIDVGCNTGELLDFCRQRGATTTGIELSHAARKICAEKGHLVASDLSSIDAPADLVFAFDLIEHLYDLPGFIRAACKALKPGGKLIILTGDNQSTTARATQERWWYARYPEHVVFPSWSFWRGCAGFGNAVRLRTYASIGYRESPIRWMRGALRILARRGNGLPLVGPDHHLLILTKP